MFPFIQAKNCGPTRPGQPIRLIVIHTMEAPEKPGTARAVATWFGGPNAPQASAHYCLAPETRVLRADLQWRPIGEIKCGDSLVATEEHSPGMGGRSLQTTLVTKINQRSAPSRRVILADEREVICSTDHRWLGRAKDHLWHWLDASWLKIGTELCVPLTPWARRDDRIAGYIEGLLDGEGCWSGAREVSFAQKEGPVLQHAISLLIEAGIPFRQHHRKESGVTVVTLSGLMATLRALGEFGSRRLAAENRWIGRSLHSRSHDNYMPVAAVEELGQRDVISIETEAHTFIAEGIISHNCVDEAEIIQCVKDDVVAWAAPGANKDGIHIEHAGYARETADDWSSSGNEAMLQRSAELAAGLCRIHGIPIQRLYVPSLMDRNATGFCGHVDITNSRSGGKGHQDPGTSFPWDHYLALVYAAYHDEDTQPNS